MAARARRARAGGWRPRGARASAPRAVGVCARAGAPHRLLRGDCEPLRLEHGHAHKRRPGHAGVLVQVQGVAHLRGGGGGVGQGAGSGLRELEMRPSGPAAAAQARPAHGRAPLGLPRARARLSGVSNAGPPRSDPPPPPLRASPAPPPPRPSRLRHVWHEPEVDALEARLVARRGEHLGGGRDMGEGTVVGTTCQGRPPEQKQPPAQTAACPAPYPAPPKPPHPPLATEPPAVASGVRTPFAPARAQEHARVETHVRERARTAGPGAHLVDVVHGDAQHLAVARQAGVLLTDLRARRCAGDQVAS